ncbi:PepSY domain-containing protein [Pacificimonas sp. WHA3]|uniref:PepSY domain-containing protein n=2 Tax=Pacificimonas pallii TaxID=2827236 RepID=A0ABS6SG74_9SPHN|nr:PepSY domain-containing protein [Pacificimonas pallii]
MANLFRRALPVHTAIGLWAGALLYILCLTGMLIVFDEEWQRWEQPDVPEMTAIAPAAVQQAAVNVLAAEAELEKRTTHLFVHLPSGALPRTIVTTDTQAFHVDGAGRIHGPETNSWTQFLLDAHYYFHLPSFIGLTLVGGLGVMMVALAISGILAHPRIFRDAFRLRARAGDRLALTDWHNRLSVWTLPFGIAAALTGALLGLASIMAVGMAETFHGGDTEAVFAPIFGEEPAADPAPAALPDLAGMMEDMAARHPDIRTSYVILHDPATAGQHVQLLGHPPRRLIFGEYYGYDGAGNFTGTAGMADGTVGQQVSASIYNLHFGNFGGLPVKLAYILLGLSLTIVSGSGMSIWLAKRRQKGLPTARLAGFWSAIVWGTPLMLALTAAARLVVGGGTAFAALFWAGMTALIIAGILMKRPRQMTRYLQCALAVTLFAVGAGHAIWISLTMSANPAGMPLWLDIAIVIIGLIIWWFSLRPRANFGSHPVPGAVSAQSPS